MIIPIFSIIVPEDISMSSAIFLRIIDFSKNAQSLIKKHGYKYKEYGITLINT